MRIEKVKTEEQKNDAFSIRRVVFVDEQQVPEELELDEHDDSAVHFVGYEDNTPVAAGRMREFDGYGKLERICVLKNHRGKQYGKRIILGMESFILDQGLNQAKLNAQTHAEAFYRSLGYETISDEFMDAGIPHVTMIKSLSH
ncbi:GNAT family N-acetyltransferase [Halobacillus litoralis]|uniref:GNAT family N-acetyltransferase n=1 Tax=Halobacillus litoralis TaxID=45668 RepID=UPI001CD49252|nr:GNAT family N-acetyltransferase [Halobacillus litoralis]MCA0969559.1 GNAT family N-acetyltransferase [Halobacillus litoralis]